MTKIDEYTATVRIRRPAKVITDELGGTVWAGAVEESEFELMSTQQFRAAMEAANNADRESIRAVAESGEEGVVARDRSTGLYSVISEAELQKLMGADKALLARKRNSEQVPEHVDPSSGEDLALVSTQALKRMLSDGDFDNTYDVLESNPGFNPYNKK